MIKHSLANYPTKFLGCVVSPTKICIQFEEVSSKLRFKQGAEYIKLPNTDKALPITTAGSQVDLLSVGCQLPVIEELQFNLVKSYELYAEKYLDVYEKNYGKGFIEFIRNLKKELTNVEERIEKNCTSS